MPALNAFLMSVRVRFAPSPTGPLHMGGVRTALYNYLFAKKMGGDFLLRIEDTDQSRFVEGAESYIREAFEWCGFQADESPWRPGDCGPYRQSERKAIYKPYVDQLLKDDKAYYAFDTPEELESMRDRAKKAGSVNWQYNSITRGHMRNSISLPSSEVQKLLDEGAPYVVRIRLERNEEVRFEDIIRSWVSVNTSNMDDKVLFKSDGMPTYHLANVVDDHLMKISHVIRGEEWLPSAPLHVLLYQYLGWSDQIPQFAHLPLLLRPDGNGKLSKRDGDRLGFPVFPLNWTSPETGETSSGYRERGFYPDAFVNLLSLLGWNPGTEQELFSMEDLIESFDLSRVGKAGARFDFEKAKWFNQQYLRQRPSEQLAQEVKALLLNQNLIVPDHLEAICSIMTERAVFASDIVNEGIFFFTDEIEYDEKAVKKKWKGESSQHIQILVDRFRALSDFNSQETEKIFKELLAEKELSFGQLGPALRIALTGGLSGPSVFDICSLLGKEHCISRLENSIAKLG